MAAPIQKLAMKSSKLFGMLSPEKITKDHLSPLIHALNGITSRDINFDPHELEERDSKLQKRGEVAPVSCMHIHQDSDFTLVVFVVKSGSVMPLHDHPKMIGLLKVIYGQARIVSYTEVDQTPIPNHLDNQLSSEKRRLVKTVYRHNDVVLSDKDECCVLTPNLGNIHEIQPETKFVAFLDILAPPYPDGYSCHYYKEMGASKPESTTWLREISPPSSFWCDEIKYKGPEIDFMNQ